MRVSQAIGTGLVMVMAVGFVAAPAMAQTPTSAVAGQRGATTAPIEPHDANSVRDQLMDVLDEYPPALGRVLKLDPSLLTNQASRALSGARHLPDAAPGHRT